VIRGRLDDAATSFEYGRKRLQVFRQRLDDHPERDSVWKECAQMAFAVVQSARAALESTTLPSSERRRLGADVRAMLDDLTALQARWTRERRGGALPPDGGAVHDERARLAVLMR
jgi:hypothetical protein